MIQKTVTITEELDKKLQLLASTEMENYSKILRDVLRTGLVITSNGVIEQSAIRVLENITDIISRTNLDEAKPCLGIHRGLTVLLEHKLIVKGVDKEGNVYFKPNHKYNLFEIFDDKIIWE